MKQKVTTIRPGIRNHINLAHEHVQKARALAYQEGNYGAPRKVRLLLNSAQSALIRILVNYK